jgi:hypothetical protein
MSANQARIWAVIGASGSGKSAFVKTALLKPKASRDRLIVWDYMREYGGLTAHQVTDIPSLVELVKAKRFAVAFQPSFDARQRAREFDHFCRIGYALGDCTMVVEELAFVTMPSFAPPAWSMVTCTGRHKGLTVIGCSQRPAQIDKNFLGNCSTVHCGRLNDANDVRVMARCLGVEEGELRQLAPLAWVERDMATGGIRRGQVKIPT